MPKILQPITIFLESDILADLEEVSRIIKISREATAKHLIGDMLKTIKVLSQNFTKQITVKIKE